MAQRRKKQDEHLVKPRVDMVVRDISFDNYMEARKDLIEKGYDVQGYQPNFWQDTSLELIHDKSSLERMEEDRMAWSKEIFTEATAKSSLEKAKDEIQEIENDMQAGKVNVEEFVDAVMCILDSAGRSGISVSQFSNAYKSKLEKNKARKWKKNPNNSYSHVK